MMFIQGIVAALMFGSVSATSYWSLGTNGFFPNSVDRELNVCQNEDCNLLRVQNLEESFDTYSVEMCRIGYEQNPTAGPHSPIVIPYSLGKELLEHARQLRREPATSYSTLVLNNCVYVGSSSPDTIPAKDNWLIKRTVAKEDEAAFEVEKGFYASHCEVEKLFAAATNTIRAIQTAVSDGQLPPRLLSQLAYNIRTGITALRHMRHFFPPDQFFSVLRPFLKCGDMGANGVIFACDEANAHHHCDETFNITLPSGKIRHVAFNQVIYGFRGPTGAMTSSLSAIDASLQIKTSIAADPNLLQTMQEFREYQPVEHVQYIEALNEMKLRDYVVSSGDGALMDAYNDAVTSVAEFRFGHIDHVSTYILKSIPHVPPKAVTGTGNTPIVSYLCKSAMGTLDSRILNDVSSRNLALVSIPTICQRECHTGALDIFDGKYCKDFAQHSV